MPLTCPAFLALHFNCICSLDLLKAAQGVAIPSTAELFCIAVCHWSLLSD